MTHACSDEGRAEAASTARKALVFFLVTFLFSWGVTIGFWAIGAARWSAASKVLILASMMAGPALGALICVWAFEKGRRRAMLGLYWTPNAWWLLAWALFVALAAGSVALTVALTDRTFVEPGAAVMSVLEAQGRAPGGSGAAPLSPAALGALVLAQSVFLAPLINGIVLTFTEELGWRGYLYALWRGQGFWRCSLATGLIWGIWHAPAILLYGHNYPDHRILGIGLFTLFCVLLTPLITLIRDKARSVIGAGVAHGTLNALGGLTILVISDARFPWNGVIGIGGFLMLAIAVAAIAIFYRPHRFYRPHGLARPHKEAA